MLAYFFWHRPGPRDAGYEDWYLAARAAEAQADEVPAGLGADRLAGEVIFSE